MFQLLAWLSNFLLGLGVGLYIYKIIYLKKAARENILTSKTSTKILYLCSFWKWSIILFIILKIALIILS